MKSYCQLKKITYYLIASALISVNAAAQVVETTANNTSSVANTLPNHNANIAEVLVTLLLIVGLILGLAWFFKRMGYNGMYNNSLMSIKACLPVSSKEKVLLIEVGDQQMLIGVAPGFVGHIASLDKSLVINDANNPQSTSTTHSTFSSVLTQLVQGKKKSD